MRQKNEFAMKYDVFISYSRKDSAIVKRFADELGKAGYTYWMDIDGVESGDEFKKKIAAAIKDSNVFIYFSSVSSNDSEWTIKEVNYAIKKKIHIIPIKLDNADYNESVDFDLCAVDFIQCANSGDFQKAIEKLLRALRNKVGVREKGDGADSPKDSNHFWDFFANSTFNARFSYLLLLFLIVSVGVGVWYNFSLTDDSLTDCYVRSVPADKVSADKVSADKVFADKASVDKEVVDEVPDNFASLDKEAVDKVPVDMVSADKVPDRIIGHRPSKKSVESVAPSNKINGHEYVDLGLPSGLKWATCNIGADSPAGYGSYFAWGEVAEKNNYIPQNSVTYGEAMDDIAGNSSYDAARVIWGGSWRLPTEAEFRELQDRNNCEWLWTTWKGIYGYRITGKKNGKSIFLPAAGHFAGTSIYNMGVSGYYWSSTPQGNYDTGNSCLLYFYSGDCRTEFNFRTTGYSVRPVSE